MTCHSVCWLSPETWVVTGKVTLGRVGLYRVKSFDKTPVSRREELRVLESIVPRTVTSLNSALPVPSIWKPARPG